MESGALVTDEIVVGIIKDAIKSFECCRGFILDDFPRTVPDEKLTKENTSVDAVASGRSNHVKFAPSNVDGKDDITGELLLQRKDDNKVTLGSRLEDFHK
uniref:Adenylate kinase active site lid domain-containing protein n=1 Tax=Peronospora matthiolae TaxID=2874970 RepID=A0AAV1T6Z3_9STRA